MPGGASERGGLHLLVYSIGVLLILGALWILAIATGWGLPYSLLVGGLDWLKNNPWNSTVVAAILLAAGLFLITRPRVTKSRSFQTPSQKGEVRISQEALQEIIARSAMVLPGVLKVQSDLRQRDSGIIITLLCQFNQDVFIPQTSEELQAKVKTDVEQYTGIVLTEVKVLVRRLDKTHLTRIR